LDAPGEPFWDPAADKALFDELERCLQVNEARQIVRTPYHINDPEFAAILLQQFLAIQV